MSCTRDARGEAKPNRTLSAPPPASAIAPAATSQKFYLTIFLLSAPPEKNSKKEREISARFRPRSFWAVRRGYQFGRGKAKTVFAVGKGFCFASALFGGGIWYPPRRRVREECAADF